MNSSSEETTNKRITVIDAMRGIALIGICLAHALQHFGGPLSSNTEPSVAWIGTMNEVTRWILNHFVMGKFFIIFSFLFGLSFFIQMNRAAQKGVDFRGRFLWRLALLFIIGLLHSAIFRLDILIIYALLGVPLVLMYQLSNKILISIALFFLLGGAQLTHIGYKALVPPSEKEVVESPSEKRQQQAIFLNESLSVNIYNNVTTQLVSKFNFQFGKYGRGYITMGFFILGLLAGRIRLFHNLDRYQFTLYRVGWTTLGGVLLLYTLRSYFPQGEMDSLLAWSSMLVRNMINLLSAYLWIILICWSYRKESIQKGLNGLVSYGRMGLTNYIAQSVIGVFVFYGFGLGLYQLGTFFSVIVCIGYTIIQVQASHYWLKKFRYGPLEWLWRTATYLKPQPLCKASVQRSAIK